jgi:hypothetical protein
MRPDDRKRVAHTIDACEEIERFLGGRMPEELESSTISMSIRRSSGRLRPKRFPRFCPFFGVCWRS